MTQQTCQICLEQVDGVLTQLCRRSCPAVVCVACTKEFVKVQTQSVLQGLVVKLNCPICIRPINLVNWHERLLGNDDEILQFEERIRVACDVKCPSCHNMRTMLPDPRESMSPLKLPTSLARRTQELKTFCGRYCRHHLQIEELYLFIRDTFQQYSSQILETILPLIHDTERRAMLFLRWRRDEPFIKTPCCNADVCFSCHTAGHHIGQPCASLESSEDIAQCPECKLHFVKGDGCDSMNCFCGQYFSWQNERMVFQFKKVSPTSLSKLARVMKIGIPFYRYKTFVRRLGATEAFFNAHLQSAMDTDRMLDHWIEGNGVTMGMSIDQLVPLNPEVFSHLPLDEFPVAPEVTNYRCRYTWFKFDGVRSIFPALLPSSFYESHSYACFMFDDTNALRLLSLRFCPAYMDTWTNPNYAPLMKYFSTIFGGNGKEEDQLIDLGHIVISIQKQSGVIHLEFVDPRNPPVINGRLFSPYFENKYLREVVIPQCKRPEIRKSMDRVMNYLKDRMWQRRWKKVLVEIENDMIARDAEEFWKNHWANISKEDKEALDDEMNSIFDIGLE
ncbi:hypothetical protein THRCLA_01402 [Thraustotheca clavata]|uniref:RING-type domain-containing protein n=1 Tax=Thraustotheca clavata TaxID=74557 RepID=A0A1W0A8R4_9STRA|nr:hypothetical protein THRCLA_01402 [Thraustotheca clavata]